MLLKIAAGDQGRITGTLQRPMVMNLGSTATGTRVSDVKGPVSSAAFEEKSRNDVGTIIAFKGPDGSVRESMLRPDGQGRLVFVFFPDHDSDMTAMLTRAPDTATVPAEWDARRTYIIRKPQEPPNSELAQLFAADQADRKGGPEGIDWSKIGPRDQARRGRVREMLDAGLLRAADDYYHAAFVYQHSEASADYLLAHVLAMASMALGRADASWIATATLDRYLWSIDRAQVFGTQYKGALGGQLTQEKYDQVLIPDSVRKVLGVPTRAQQESQRQQLNQQMPAAGAVRE
jgi:hypothetical protein